MDCDRTGPIDVDLREDRCNLLYVHLLLRQDGLRDEVLIVLRAVDGVLAEDARQHVQDGHLSETDVGDEEGHPHLAHVGQGQDNLRPTHAARDGDEQREHAAGDSRPVMPERRRELNHVRGLLLFRALEIQHALREQDGKQVDNHHQQQKCPNQGTRCRYNLMNQRAQGSDKTDDPRHPNTSDDASRAQDAHDAELGRPT
mmetsp:Transcript_126414/g.328233  ORF Transcript_126414/g.328233 Transcript_126414/m.328233 type:complete len:200 (-) Transcript_126414:132-731(-)